MKKTSQDRAGRKAAELLHALPRRCPHLTMHQNPWRAWESTDFWTPPQGLRSAGLRWGLGSMEHPGDADTSTLERCLEDHCIEAILGSIHFTSYIYLHCKKCQLFFKKQSKPDRVLILSDWKRKCIFHHLGSLPPSPIPGECEGPGATCRRLLSA